MVYGHFSFRWSLHERANCTIVVMLIIDSRPNVSVLQYFMQRCRISNRTITQPFLTGLSWNLAWLLLRCKQSSYCYLGGKDEVRRQNIVRAAPQYSMQGWRISNRTITMPFLNLLGCNFFYDFLHEEGLIFKNSIFWGPLAKLKSIFELAENLSLVLTKLD